MNNKPRYLSIKDKRNLTKSELKPVDPRDISKSIREEYGYDPEVEEETYDSYVDQIINTVGKDMADEMFEQAKDIIYNKAIDIQVSGDSKDQIKEHTTKADDVPIETPDIKINRVPGPKRRK